MQAIVADGAVVLVTDKDEAQRMLGIRASTYKVLPIVNGPTNANQQQAIFLGLMWKTPNTPDGRAKLLQLMIENRFSEEVAREAIEAVAEVIDALIPEEYKMTDEQLVARLARQFGSKIDMIKRFRELRGCGLKEAKDTVQKHLVN